MRRNSRVTVWKRLKTCVIFTPPGKTFVITHICKHTLCVLLQLEVPSSHEWLCAPTDVNVLPPKIWKWGIFFFFFFFLYSVFQFPRLRPKQNVISPSKFGLRQNSLSCQREIFFICQVDTLERRIESALSFALASTSILITELKQQPCMSRVPFCAHSGRGLKNKVRTGSNCLHPTCLMAF